MSPVNVMGHGLGGLQDRGAIVGAGETPYAQALSGHAEEDGDTRMGQRRRPPGIACRRSLVHGAGQARPRGQTAVRWGHVPLRRGPYSIDHGTATPAVDGLEAPFPY